MENLKFNLQYPLILGSNSPRRKEILQECGFNFTVLPSYIEEDFPHDLSIEKVPAFLAEKKADSIIPLVKKKSLILCSDTVVIVEGKILNKPENPAHAYEMLQLLSGKSHQVITAFCLVLPNGKKIIESDITLVEVKKLAKWEIEFYIKQGKGMDKAGGYGIQDFFGMVGIKKLEGSYYTVMGLPIDQIFQHISPYLAEANQLSI